MLVIITNVLILLEAALETRVMDLEPNNGDAAYLLGMYISVIMSH